MKDKIFGVLQRVGRSFMLPIAILPVAGLLLGIGSSFTNETTIATYGLQKILGSGTLLNSLLIIMNKVGSAVFDNLPLIFAVGVAIGMAKKEKEVAALSALIAYFVMNVAVSAMLLINNEITADGQIAADVLEGTITSVCGIQSLQMGVFGGIIVGLGVAALHNRFHKIVLPNALSFFGGSRFIPIISTIVYMFVGILMYFVWPVVQNGIYALGGLVTGSGYLGTLIFGIIKRALIPFGLHHVFYMPFWQTAVGGTMEVAGQVVQGGQNIFFAQLADSANIAHFSADATRYFSGEFIFMIFGLPGAALAMYRCAKSEKKKAAGGLLLSAALACMFTGITEPLEFSFLFVAPALFVVQVILAGAAYMIAHMLNIAVGLTFSGGFLDLFLFGILQGNAKTSWLRIIPVGIIYFILYYVIFTFMIRKFNFKTPGREDDDTETKLYTKADVNARKEAGKTAGAAAATSGDPVSELITRGLGGKKNIVDVDCCATRLRITVAKPEKVRDELLKQDEPEAKEIALAIELFTHGSLNTFAKQTNVDTHNRLICYDILDLGKQLMPIGMLVVLDSILNRITQNRAKGKNTFIFIDEIYLLFQHEYSANFLFTLWKRVRKYCAYASGITQNVDDLLQSHTARTMLANSEFIIMLNQASTDRLELAKLLNISDLQLSYITNVDAGHGLIKVGSSLVPFANKFPKNTKLYKLMTTKPGEV